MWPLKSSESRTRGFRRLFRGFPELWNDGLHSRKNKKKDPFCAVKKKKPVVVSDILPLSSVLVLLLPSSICPSVTVSSALTAPSRPYIVYMLQDLDILEDWTAIRKVNKHIVGPMLI